MKKSSKNSTSKKYLKALGIIYIIMSILVIVMGVVFLATKMDVSQLGLDLAKLHEQNLSDDNIRLIASIGIMCAGVIDLIIGWLLCRAAKDAHKSTFVLVLTVLSLVSSLVSIFTQNNFASASGSVGFIIGVTIDVLTLMALLNIRKEIE